MSTPSGFLGAPAALVQMGHSKWLGFIKVELFSCIIKIGFMGLALFAIVSSGEKVEAPSSSSGIFCISDCVTCPVICSPPPPLLTTSSYPPPSPSLPHSPSYLIFSPPPPKSQSSVATPPPPLKSYNPPPSGSAQPQPTVISGPHDYPYPYYYFYASGASSLSIHAPFFLLLLLVTSSFIR